MNQAQPSRSAAQAALAEAAIRTSQVRRADRQLGWMLAVLASMDLVIAGLMSAAFHVVGPAVLAVYLVAIALVVVVLVRVRVYSRTGLQLFSVSATPFTLWNALVSGVSLAARWWGPAQPGYHFGISAVIGVLPLLVGIWLLFRKSS